MKESKRINKDCLNCGTNFTHFKSKERKFCCHKCSSDYNSGPNNSRYTKKERKCLNCEKIFVIQQKEINKGSGKYCSYKCLAASNAIKNKEKWEPLRVKKKCAVCNNITSTKKSHAATGGGTYCSKKCMSSDFKTRGKGENNPNWRGGITTENARQRQTVIYKEWRKAVLKRDNNTCKDCGQVGGILHVHHKKSFRKYKELRTELSNGITLCFDCHSKYHPHIKKFNIHGKNRTQNTE